MGRIIYINITYVICISAKPVDEKWIIIIIKTSVKFLFYKAIVGPASMNDWLKFICINTCIFYNDTLLTVIDCAPKFTTVNNFLHHLTLNSMTVQLW